MLGFDVVRDAIARHQKAQKYVCDKVPYFTIAKAKRALRDHGYAIGCKQWYLCPHCDGEVYHLTSKRRFDRKP